jgi:hypothetical protein
VPIPEAKQPEKKPVANVPKVNLILAANRDLFTGILPYLYDSVLQSCAARLNDSSGVQVEVVPREMTRSDAVKRAKAEKDGFLVWLQLRVDNFSGSSANSLDGIYIDYTVFESTTAKVRTQGNAYQAAHRQGGVVIPGTSGRSSSAITESRLREAAQDAAERILKALHVASRSDIPPH